MPQSLGTSSQRTNSSQTQNSTTAPWEPTQGLLQGIINGLGQYANIAPTGAETGALNQIQANAQNTPNYGTQANSLVNDLFSGGPNYGAGVSDALKQYQTSLTPFAQGNYLDPTQAPGMQSVLDTIRSDVGNQINGLFAGAGRDLSGAHTQTLARGIAQGEAAPLLAQYQQNQGIQQNAINNLLQGGILGANTLSSLNQTGLGNRLQALPTAAAANEVANLGPNSVLQAAQQQRGLPLSNLGNLESLLLPIAGLGSQSHGTATGTSNTTAQASPLQMFSGLTSGFTNLLGGQYSPVSNFLGLFGRRA